MIDQLKKKLDMLEAKKSEIKPRVEELKEKKEREREAIDEKYHHLIAEVTLNVDRFENEVFNDFINSYLDAVMEEFDAKRSITDYVVTERIKQYREEIATIEMFPKELIGKLDRVISGVDQIENIVYYVDDIKNKYLKL